jgi:g-D-glutamyl-meso-diaminopimelate peptidase
VDLNLNYPAGWEQAKENKYALGYDRPAPRDFVGQAPLNQTETLAMVRLTEDVAPRLTLSYHTQGEVIYWRFLDYEPASSRAIGEIFARSSGYLLEDTPFASGFAGYKDWFIQEYNRPGYTVEVGRGTNPLPLSQFDDIYEKNLGILTLGLQL